MTPEYPLAPLVVALVLRHLAERALRRSLIISDGSLTIFFTPPLAAVLMAPAFLLLFWPFLHYSTSPDMFGRTTAAERYDHQTYSMVT
jgi:TctA family transporter